MAFENSAIETAARFGEIPFAEFTKSLIQDTFHALLEAHLTQMEEYQTFVQALATTLGTYINTTINDYSLQDVLAFVDKLPLGQSAPEIVGALTAAGTDTAFQPPSGAPAIPADVWTSLINALAPVARDAVNAAMGTPTNAQASVTLATLQAAPIKAAESFVTGVNTNNKILYRAIAATLASNKYALMQNMARLGMLRLVVSDGEIETKINFSTWEEHERKTQTRDRDREVSAFTRGATAGLGLLFRGGALRRARSVAVSTTKSYHRDTAGSKVDIYGRVLIRFKTDYAPLGE